MPLYLQLLHEALQTEVSALTPVIAILLMVGLSTAFIQAVFQFEDSAFAQLPKIFAMIAIALFGGFGIMQRFAALATLWISHAAMIVRHSWS